MAKIDKDPDYFFRGKFYFKSNNIFVAFFDKYQHIFIKHDISYYDYFLSFSLKRSKFEEWKGFGSVEKGDPKWWENPDSKWEEI